MNLRVRLFTSENKQPNKQTIGKSEFSQDGAVIGDERCNSGLQQPVASLYYYSPPRFMKRYFTLKINCVISIFGYENSVELQNCARDFMNFEIEVQVLVSQESGGTQHVTSLFQQVLHVDSALLKPSEQIVRFTLASFMARQSAAGKSPPNSHAVSVGRSCRCCRNHANLFLGAEGQSEDWIAW